MHIGSLEEALNLFNAIEGDILKALEAEFELGNRSEKWDDINISLSDIVRRSVVIYDGWSQTDFESEHYSLELKTWDITAFPPNKIYTIDANTHLLYLIAELFLTSTANIIFEVRDGSTYTTVNSREIETHFKKSLSIQATVYSEKITSEIKISRIDMNDEGEVFNLDLGEMDVFDNEDF